MQRLVIATSCSGHHPSVRAADSECRDTANVQCHPLDLVWVNNSASFSHTSFPQQWHPSIPRVMFQHCANLTRAYAAGKSNKSSKHFISTVCIKRFMNTLSRKSWINNVFYKSRIQLSSMLYYKVCHKHHFINRMSNDYIIIQYKHHTFYKYSPKLWEQSLSRKLIKSAS